MLKTISKLFMGLCLMGIAAQLSVNDAQSQPKWADKTGSDLYNSLPKGLQSKFSPNGSGGYTFTGNHLNKNFARIDSNLNCPGCTEPESDPDGDNFADNSGNGFVLCPTSLPEDQLRECLGQPAKKPVRVKKIKVKLTDQPQ